MGDGERIVEMDTFSQMLVPTLIAATATAHLFIRRSRLRPYPIIVFTLFVSAIMCAFGIYTNSQLSIVGSVAVLYASFLLLLSKVSTISEREQ